MLIQKQRGQRVCLLIAVICLAENYWYNWTDIIGLMFSRTIFFPVSLCDVLILVTLCCAPAELLKHKTTIVFVARNGKSFTSGAVRRFVSNNYLYSLSLPSAWRILMGDDALMKSFCAGIPLIYGSFVLKVSPNEISACWFCETQVRSSKRLACGSESCQFLLLCDAGKIYFTHCQLLAEIYEGLVTPYDQIGAICGKHFRVS